MTYPLVQFVSAPEVGATVRFDFNASLGVDVESFPEHEGFSLGAPEMIGNPGEYGTSWGDRELTLTAFIEGSRSAAFAAQTSLARELWRRENWLLFQLDATSPPRWFKTYRSGPGAASFDNVYLDREPDLWGIPITLTAEGGAYGPKETIGPVTITNNPSSGTNPMSYVLPEIKGDMPAPLRVDLSTSVVQASRRFLLASGVVGDAHPAPLVWQIGTGDTWALGADTGAAVANSAFSGGSYRPVTFATTSGLSRRISGAAPVTPAPGRYKVLLRAARSDTASKFDLALTVDYTTGATVGFDRSTTTSAGYAQWFDLGDFTMPGGLSDPEATTGKAPQIYLDIARTSGAGEIRLDAFMLVPLADDSRLMFSTFGLVGTGASPWVARWDGEAEYFQMYEAGAAVSIVSTLNQGSYLYAYPGARNLFHLVLSTASIEPFSPTSDNSDLISTTSSVTFSYMPRYLWIGGA